MIEYGELTNYICLMQKVRKCKHNRVQEAPNSYPITGVTHTNRISTNTRVWYIVTHGMVLTSCISRLVMLPSRYCPSLKELFVLSWLSLSERWYQCAFKKSPMITLEVVFDGVAVLVNYTLSNTHGGCDLTLEVDEMKHCEIALLHRMAPWIECGQNDVYKR